jgi:O-antigen/teichoic acid export membrane protein
LISIKSTSTKFIIILISRIIASTIGIFFVPLYVKIIGSESYGLIAFFGTLTVSLSILDMGLSTTISRQVSVLKVKDKGIKEIADLVFSSEIIYWLIALFAGIIIILLANPISLYWVKAKDLPISTIKTSIMLMGATFACSFPTSIYLGVLNSLELQLQSAIINMFGAIFKFVVVIILLKFFSQTVEMYFGWQILISFILTITFRFYTWYGIKKIQKKLHPTFSIFQLKTIWKFAAGMTGISLITFFLSQVDKIVVSKFVTLDLVGYYGLAFTLAGGITLFISPIIPIVFPKFSTLVAENKKDELSILYQKSCRIISILVMPLGCILIIFAKELLTLWTHNQILVENTTTILKICVAGTALNTLMWIPYWYMLANGITKYTIYQNIIASLILVPLLFWWTSKYGILGASFVWFFVNAGYIIISIPILHKLFLKGQLTTWYKNAFFLPIIYSAISGIIVKLFYSTFFSAISYFSVGFSILLFVIIYFCILPEKKILYKVLKSKIL